MQISFIEATRAHIDMLIAETARRLDAEMMGDIRLRPEPKPTTWQERYRDRWQDELNEEDEDY
jgi:hypothetical protein